MKSPESRHEQSTLLLFSDNGRLFGIPSLDVLEILYPHPVTPLPFVSPAIEGLINVEGRIAVQLSLARMVGEPLPAPRAELVLIDTGRALCALKVDAVLSRDSFAGIQPGNPLPDGDPFAALVNGSVNWNGITVPVLSPGAIGRLVRPEAIDEHGTGLIGSEMNETGTADENNLHCLVTLVSGERYALPLHQVVEIVEAGHCMPLSGASHMVDGMFLLRDQVVLVADLATRLGQPRTRLQESGWYVLVEHEEGRCAFAVDEILEIERLDHNRFQQAGDADSLIEGVFALPEANVLLLGAPKLVNEELAALLARHHQDAQQLQQQEAENSLRFLEIRLADTLYAIPADTIKRITRAFPMENTQDTSGRIRGAIELDGRVIPVLALEYGLALPKPVEDREYIIFGNDEDDWAIGVDAVQRIVNVPVSQVNHLRRQDARYVGGVAHIDGRLVSTLDFSHLSSASLQEGART